MKISSIPSAARPVLSATAIGLLAACAGHPADSAGGSGGKGGGNPFLSESRLQNQYPPFDRINDASYRPAFEAGMAEQRKEVDAIAESSDPPTFENTVVALERSGRILYRVQAVFSNLNGANTDDEMQKIDEEMSPRLSQHQDAILLNGKLFARIKGLHDQADHLGLDPESQQLLQRTYLQFVRAGALASDADKERLRQLNSQLSSLSTQFTQNVLKSSKDGAVVIDDKAQLDGFSEDQISAAAEAAKARGLDGKWLLPLRNTTNQPALKDLKNRAVREKLYRASIARSIGGPADNTAVISQIVKLRADRAKILGYPSHAAYVLEDETAGTTTAVNKMLGELAPPAFANARKEAAEIQKLIDKQAKAGKTKSFKLQPWDWDFYSEQVRKEKYDIDESQTKPYFELNRVLNDGVFYAANGLYGLTFKERKDLPVYNPDVRVFEVFDADGSSLALFIADYYARDNKQGGAWENQYVDQSRLFGTKSVVANHLNISKPADGQPTLLTFDEVTTLFHEFGHALHAMLSNVQYQSLSGTNTPPDFVEYPSQFNEMWAREPSVLTNYAKHYQTGEAMPKALLDKMLSAQKFNQGFATGEYISAAIVDQSWHQIPAAKADKLAPPADKVMAFEQKVLEDKDLDFGPVPPRYHSPYFLHIFSNGYSAGYYAYLWSDVLARDTESWMHQHGGLKRENGDVLRAKVLSRGRTSEPSALFRDFYGKGPDIGPLLERRGLTLAGNGSGEDAPAKAVVKKKKKPKAKPKAEEPMILRLPM